MQHFSRKKGAELFSRKVTIELFGTRKNCNPTVGSSELCPRSTFVDGNARSSEVIEEIFSRYKFELRTKGAE